MSNSRFSQTIPVIEVKNFSFYFSNCPKLPVVDNISFALHPNEFMGIIGESGSGKSVTAKAILQLNSYGGKCSEESEIIYGDNNLLKVPYEKIREIRGKEIALVFQDPMTYLNPTATVGSQIEEVYKLHSPKMPKSETYKKTLEMLRLVELANQKQIYQRYPHELSGGMRQRVMIAISLAAKPRIFIADEITTALDVTLQREILQLLKKLQKEIAMSIIFISHDLSIVSSFADSIAVMYKGKIVEYGSCTSICTNPTHPYTKALIGSIPTLNFDENSRLECIEDLRERSPQGCGFYHKCKFAKDLCKNTPPSFKKQEEANALCHFPLSSKEKEKTCPLPVL